MKNRTLQDLDEADRTLVEAAHEAADRAYAPYSCFAVGAAVRSASGTIHLGANLENASYGLSLCAEAVALGAANTAGAYDIHTIAVVGRTQTAATDRAVVTPCGRCRQLIAEAAGASDVDVRVLSCNADLTRIVESAISELLPQAFGPASLTAKP